MPPGDAAPERAHGRLRRALLLRAGTGAAARRGTHPALRVAGPLRGASRRSSSELGAAIGGEYRVLVDANQHVDREGAARSGVGFYGKNTLLITRRFGSWVVLGTLVTDAEIEATPPLELDCGSCRLCIDACPTGALDEPGTLDATRCLSYWTQAPGPIPEEMRAPLEDRVYGCDICQDVCPWNRGIEKRRADEPPRGEPAVSLVEWLEADDAELRARWQHLYVPRNDARHLKRNAIVALGNTGSAEHVEALERLRGRSAARRARRVGARADRGANVHLTLLRQTERWIAYVRAAAVVFAVLQVIVVRRLSAGLRAEGVDRHDRASRSARRCCSRAVASTCRVRARSRCR